MAYVRKGGWGGKRKGAGRKSTQELIRLADAGNEKAKNTLNKQIAKSYEKYATRWLYNWHKTGGTIDDKLDLATYGSLYIGLKSEGETGDVSRTIADDARFMSVKKLRAVKAVVRKLKLNTRIYTDTALMGENSISKEFWRLVEQSGGFKKVYYDGE